MNHRKARSYSESGSEVFRVPFSWEEKPGIPKFIIHSQSCAKNAAELSTPSSILQLPLRNSASFNFHGPVNTMMSVGYTNTMKISPPPFGAHQRAPSRSSSRKGFWKQQQDDPFAAAIKKCTESITIQGMAPGIGGSKIDCTGPYKEKNPKITFSCKKSCDVKDDHLVRLVDHLPPRPRGKNKGLAR